MDEFIKIQAKALAEIILNSYKRGFKDAMSALEAVDIDKMFTDEDVKKLIEMFSAKK